MKCDNIRYKRYTISIVIHNNKLFNDRKCVNIFFLVSTHIDYSLTLIISKISK